ncbi:response regulator transcription factor [Tunturiibacter lichenicola]|uniref:response regulator transcription factor n=1 Tax=Tunturiibacter lichenicola TaxID=2051959 RepID=UPI003D9AD32F
MTTQASPATFVPIAQTEFQYHYQHNSEGENGPSVSLQVRSRTATKAAHSSLPSDCLGIGCKEIHTSAKPRFEDRIVHIVRNDPAGTKSLADFFLSERLSVVTFRTAADYMTAPRDDRPTCLILDLDLPDLHGLDIQSRLADKGAPPVVFVTSHCDPIFVVRAMKSGAIDFMLEPVDYGNLMSAVELAFIEDLKNRNARIELSSLLARWWSLTPREAEVFHYTVAGLLNKQAAAELGVAENTYQVHRGRVMRKMEANSLADLVRMSTKLEPILPKPCRTRICYGTAVEVPVRIEKLRPHLQSKRNESKRASALKPY